MELEDPGRKPLHELVLELLRGTRAEDPAGLGLADRSYRVRWDQGRYEDRRFPWSEDVEADLRRLAEPGVAGRMRTRLRELLPAADLGPVELGIREALRQERHVVLTIRSDAAELHTLPWELLTLGESVEGLGQHPACLLRYEWPGTDTAACAPDPPPEGGRILFAWADPLGQGMPHREHVQAIRQACGEAFVAFEPERDVLSEASLEELREALEPRSGRPPVNVLHLLCPAAPQAGREAGPGLLWHAADARSGDGEVVGGAELAGLLQPLAGTLRLVVLCACDGGEGADPGIRLAEVAQALHRHARSGIAAVIGARLPLSKPGSVEMARALYRKLLVETCGVEEAFVAARTAAADAGHGLDWAVLQLHARAADGVDTRPIAFRPYRGLLRFGPEHRRFFFGRSRERRRLKERVEQAAEGKAPRFQVVAGASGSGSSSLVLAGLVPDLAESGGPAWKHSVFTPTRAPDAMLCQALGRLAVQLGLAEPRDTRSAMEALQESRPRENLLLVVDQFEEIFTQNEDPGVRDAFVRNLWSLAQAETLRMVVVVVTRIDFLERCRPILLEPGRRRFDQAVLSPEHHTFIEPMSPEQLLEAITRPAWRLGLELEEGLAERLVDAVGDEPGSLPLLELALDQLWQRRRGRRLSSGAVEGMAGMEKTGLDGVLRAKAGELIKELQHKSPRYLTQVRRLFVKLVDLRDEAPRDVRRRVWVEELRPSSAGAQAFFDKAVARLVEERLVVRGEEAGHSRRGLDGPWLELAHESLIRRWDLLRSWIGEARAHHVEIRKLEDRQAEWQGHVGDLDGGRAYLLREGPLAAALDLRRHVLEELPQEVERYVARSEQQEAWDRAKEEEQRRRHLEALDRARVEAEQKEEEARAGQMTEASARRETELKLEEATARHLTETGLRQSAERAVRRLRRRAITLAAALLAMLGATTASLWVAHQALRHEGEAQDALRMAAVRTFGNSDPTLALLFLKEVAQPDQAPGWMQASLQVLQRPVAKAILRGHRAGVSLASFSPDGGRVLTASLDGTARVWKADGSGEPIVLRGHGGEVDAAAFSPDGTHVATTSSDGTVRIWRADGLGAPVVLEGHTGKVGAVAFSPDGTRVATASEDGTARVWKADGGAEPVVLGGHEGKVDAVAFSPDGTRVVTASLDGTAQVWRADGRGEPSVFPGIEGGARSAAFSPDGTQVLIASGQASAWLWKPDGNEAPRVLDGSGGCITTAVFSSDGTRVVTASEDGTARVWMDDAEGEPIVLKGHGGAVLAAAFSPDGTRVVTASEDGTARVWTASMGPEPVALRGHAGRIRSVAFSPDEVFVATASEDKTARVWRVDGQGEPIVLQGHEGAVNSVRFSPDGTRVITASDDKTARLWRVDGQGEPLVLQEHEEAVDFAEFSPDGRRVVTTSSDGTARVWKADGVGARVVLKHRAAVSSARFSPEGTRVVTACADGVARVWKADGSSLPLELKQGTPVLSAAFSPDGMRVVTAGVDGVARVWKADGSGTPVLLAGHGSRIASAGFSPDGKSVLTASWDGTVRVWNADGSGHPVVLEGAERGFDSAGFSPDGTKVVAACRDGSMWVWNADGSGKPVVLEGDGREILSAGFSPDGTRVATAAGGMALLWPVSTKVLQERLAQATSACLPVKLRQSELGESLAQAQTRFRQCRGE
jgi:WD40 repeat protein